MAYKRKPKLKISMQDIENLYKPIKKEVMNTENKIEVPATVEPNMPELKKGMKFNIISTPLNMKEGEEKVLIYHSRETVEIYDEETGDIKINKQGKEMIFDSLNFVEIIGDKASLKHVSCGSLLYLEKKGKLIPNEVYSLKYNGKKQSEDGLKTFHDYEIYHISKG